VSDKSEASPELALAVKPDTAGMASARSVDAIGRAIRSLDDLGQLRGANGVASLRTIWIKVVNNVPPVVMHRPT